MYFAGDDYLLLAPYNGGSSAYIAVAFKATMTSWFKPMSLATGEDGCIVIKQQMLEGYDSTTIALHLKEDGQLSTKIGFPDIRAGSWDGFAREFAYMNVAATDVVLNKWHHWLWTINGHDGIKLDSSVYFNGVKKASYYNGSIGYFSYPDEFMAVAASYTHGPGGAGDYVMHEMYHGYMYELKVYMDTKTSYYVLNMYATEFSDTCVGYGGCDLCPEAANGDKICIPNCDEN